MLKKAYDKIIGNKIFNKVIIVFSIIIVTTMTLLVFIVSDNIMSILTTQSLSYNSQILRTIDRYFEEQCRDAKNIHQQILQDADVYNKVRKLLEYKDDTDSDSYYSLRRDLEKTMFNKLDIYSDIKHIYLFNLHTMKYLSFYRSADDPRETLYSMKFMDYTKKLSEKDRGTQRLFITPSIPVTNQRAQNFQIFAMYDYIRDNEDFSNILGSILFDYDCASIKQSYSLYEQYLKGYLMILGKNGEVIFDSSGKYYDHPFPLFEQIRGKGSESLSYEDGLINIVRNNTFDFISVGIIPFDDLHKDIDPIRDRIYFFSISSILVILCITFFSTKMISRRLKTVIHSIHRIQKGDFETRIQITNQDEIGEIAESLNQMSEKIKEYIEREFVSELKIKDAEIRQREAELKQNEAVLRQKTAELYALQSQINPHFLYNTLEAIRMRALSTNQGEVGRMIQTLAAMFRNSIKDEMIVSIKDELDFCNSYLELYNIRFAGRLKVEFDIEKEILSYSIIKHLLHPIIENSIIHGIDLDQDGNLITVRGYRSGEDIELVISDNGHGIDEKKLQKIQSSLTGSLISSKESVGITNVNSRIKLLFGDSYGLTIWSSLNSGTQVTVKIQAKTREELKFCVQSIDRG